MGGEVAVLGRVVEHRPEERVVEPGQVVCTTVVAQSPTGMYPSSMAAVMSSTVGWGASQGCRPSLSSAPSSSSTSSQTWSSCRAIVREISLPPGASMPGAHDFTERRSGRMLGPERGA